MDLELNNPKCLMSHETKTNQTKIASKALALYKAISCQQTLKSISLANVNEQKKTFLFNENFAVHFQFEQVSHEKRNQDDLDIATLMSIKNFQQNH